LKNGIGRAMAAKAENKGKKKDTKALKSQLNGGERTEEESKASV